MLIWIALFLFVALGNGGLFDPTPEEINRKIVVGPPHGWGRQARHQKSLRILCIGGSNTAPFDDGLPHDSHYVYYLDQYVKQNMSKYLLPNHSYALSRGVSGQGPEHFIGKKFDFEFEDKGTWPNLIIFEFAVNMPDPIKTPRNQTLLFMEQLVHSLRFKYKKNSLPCPDFMFFNVDHTLQLVLASLRLTNYSERLDFVQHYWELPNVNNSDHIIKEFAQYYRIPIISWGDVVTPAAFRHFLNHTTRYYDEPWAYSREGIHIKGPFGSMFAVNQLLGPFLQDMMATSDSAENAAAADQDISRFFPPTPILMEMASYSSYGRPISIFDLRDIVHDLNHSEWKVKEFPHMNYCFGTDVRGSVGEVRFHVPPACNQDYLCQIQLYMMRSGNTSRIGNSSCNLHRHHDNSPVKIESSLFIDGQAGVTWNTAVVAGTFDVNVTEGKYSVKCVNLLERLSCMASLSINSVVMV